MCELTHERFMCIENILQNDWRQLRSKGVTSLEALLDQQKVHNTSTEKIKRATSLLSKSEESRILNFKTKTSKQIAYNKYRQREKYFELELQALRSKRQDLLREKQALQSEISQLKSSAIPNCSFKN